MKAGVAQLVVRLGGSQAEGRRFETDYPLFLF